MEKIMETTTLYNLCIANQFKYIQALRKNTILVYDYVLKMKAEIKWEYKDGKYAIKSYKPCYKI